MSRTKVVKPEMRVPPVRLSRTLTGGQSRSEQPQPDSSNLNMWLPPRCATCRNGGCDVDSRARLAGSRPAGILANTGRRSSTRCALIATA